jgi:putative aminopeptidase FrvX
VKVRDSGMVSDRRIVEWMTAAADARRIPHQMEVLEHGTTDAAVIQAARAGVPAGCLSIPCRYNHSPSEMVDLDDVENAVQLLLAMLQGAADFNP